PRHPRLPFRLGTLVWRPIVRAVELGRTRLPLRKARNVSRPPVGSRGSSRANHRRGAAVRRESRPRGRSPGRDTLPSARGAASVTPALEVGPPAESRGPPPDEPEGGSTGP